LRKGGFRSSRQRKCDLIGASLCIAAILGSFKATAIGWWAVLVGADATLPPVCSEG
jgi:hypothetical protein